MHTARGSGRLSCCRPVFLWLIVPALVAAGCGRRSAAPGAFAGDAVPASRETAGPGPILAQARSEWPHLHVEVLALTRSAGERLDLTLAFVNTSSTGETVLFGQTFAAATADRNTIADTYLIDPVGQKKYYILRDREGRPICSTETTAIAAGTRRIVSAAFPAPPVSTSAVSIRIPHVAALDGIPVAGGEDRDPRARSVEPGQAEPPAAAERM